jgi:hypothetical protein
MKLPSSPYETLATGFPKALPYTHAVLPAAGLFTVTILAAAGSPVVLKRRFVVLVNGGASGSFEPQRVVSDVCRPKPSYE